MNEKKIKCSAFGLAVCVLAAAANADLIMGQPVTTGNGWSTATIEFQGSSAGYTGELYFLGWGTQGAVLHQAANSNGSNLGQLLFNNHQSISGSSVALDGVFDSGSVLHFAYKVLTNGDLFRTDVESDHLNFAYDADNGHYAVEDLRMDYRGYDGDFNDAEFAIDIQSVPAPGSLALLGLGGLAMTRRRRR